MPAVTLQMPQPKNCTGISSVCKPWSPTTWPGCFGSYVSFELARATSPPDRRYVWTVMDDDGTESATDAGDETAAPVAVATNAQRARTIAMLLGHGVVTWSLRLALPLVFANALLRAFPYRAKVAGVPFRVQGTLFTRRGFTADTTFGNWEFPHVDGLPIGVHVSPIDVDLLRLSRAANQASSVFVDH